MAVVSASILTVKPDRYEEFETTCKAKAVLERCGARNIRASQPSRPERASGSVVMTWDTDDLGSQRAVLVKFVANPDGWSS